MRSNGDLASVAAGSLRALSGVWSAAAGLVSPSTLSMPYQHVTSVAPDTPPAPASPICLVADPTRLLYPAAVARRTLPSAPITSSTAAARRLVLAAAACSRAPPWTLGPLTSHSARAPQPADTSIGSTSADKTGLSIIARADVAANQLSSARVSRYSGPNTLSRSPAVPPNAHRHCLHR